MKVLFLVIITLLLNACDFTTGVSRRILNAQEHVDNYRYQQALDEYHLLIDLNLTNKIEYKIYYQMAEIYNLYLFDKTNALKYYEKLQGQKENNTFKKIAIKKAAQLSFELKDYRKAIKYYTSFIENKLVNISEKPFYKMQIGISYFELSDWKKAESTFISISTDKNVKLKARSLFYLGQISSYRGDEDEAISLWKSSLKFEKDSKLIVETKFYIGNTYERQNKLQIAYDYYYSIINLYPNPSIIKKRLKSVYDRKVSRRR